MTPTNSVILEHNDDIPLVEIRHILRSGASCEPRELAGLGRIALRLLRRGAAGMGRQELDASIDRIAAIFSAQSTPDFYAFHVRVLRKHLERAIELFSKILHEPSLDPDELERLKRETFAEIVSSRDDDRYLASRALRLLVFGDHPYGQPARGTLESVSRITLDDIHQFVDEHLNNSNFLIGAAGDVTRPELDTILEKTVGGLGEKANASKFQLKPARPTKGLKVTLIDKPERAQTQILLGHLGPQVNDPFDMPLRVALTAFGGTFTSTLMQEIRVKRGWSYGAYASLGRARLPEILNLWAFPAVTDAPDCLKLLIELYSNLHHHGPAEDDIAFARDFLARGVALQRDTAASRLTLRLRQEILQLPEDYYDTFADRVRQVTHDQTVEAVQTHLSGENLAVAITCTARELEEKVRDVLGDAADIEVIPYDSPLL